MRAQNRDFPPAGTLTKSKDGFSPSDGSAAPQASYVSGPAGRPVATTSVTGCQAARTTPDPVAHDRWASLRASPRRLGEGRAKQRHDSERGDMTEHISSAGKELIDIHNRESAEMAAMVREMTTTVARLGREAREMREEITRIRNAATAAPSSTPRTPGAVPDARR